MSTRSSDQEFNKRAPLDPRANFRYTTPGRDVVARPTDPYIRPASPLRSFVDSLNSMQGVVGSYEKAQHVKNLIDEEKGKAKFARGETLEGKESLALVRGYETLEGQAKTADFRLAYQKYLEENKEADPSEFAAGLEQLRESYINGMSDNHLRGFVERAMVIEEQTKAAYQQYQQQLVKQNTRTFNREAMGDKMLETLMKSQRSVTPKQSTSASKNWEGLTPTYSGQYSGMLSLAAQRRRPGDAFFEALANRVLWQESRGQLKAVSPAGAGGLMQLMPGTAAELGVSDRFDPEQNIRGGVEYLARQFEAFDGNPILALIAYNAGPGNARKFAKTWDWNSLPKPEETLQYVQRILGTTEPDGFPKRSMDPRPPAFHGKELDLEAALPALQQLYQEQRALAKGILTDGEIQEDFIETLTEIAVNTRSPEILRVAFLKDKDGFSLIRSAVPGMQEKIMNAMTRAEAARDQYQNRIEREVRLAREEAARVGMKDILGIYTDTSLSAFERGQKIQSYVQQNLEVLPDGAARQYFDVGKALASGTFGEFNNGATVMELRNMLLSNPDPQAFLARVNTAAQNGEITESTYGEYMNAVGRLIGEREGNQKSVANIQQQQVWSTIDTQISSELKADALGNLMTSAEDYERIQSRRAEASTIFWEEVQAYREANGKEPTGVDLMKIRDEVFGILDLKSTSRSPTAQQIEAQRTANAPPAELDERLTKLEKAEPPPMKPNEWEEGHVAGFIDPVSQQFEQGAESGTHSMKKAIDFMTDVFEFPGKQLERGMTETMWKVLDIPRAAVMAPYRHMVNHSEVWATMPEWVKPFAVLSIGVKGALWDNFVNPREVGRFGDMVQAISGQTLEESLPEDLRKYTPLVEVIGDILTDPLLLAGSAQGIINAIGTRRLSQELARASQSAQYVAEQQRVLDEVSEMFESGLNAEQQQSIREFLKTMYKELKRKGEGVLADTTLHRLWDIKHGTTTTRFTHRNPDPARDTVARQLGGPVSRPALPRMDRDFVMVEPGRTEALFRTMLKGDEAEAALQRLRDHVSMNSKDFILFEKDVVQEMLKAYSNSPYLSLPGPKKYRALPEYIPDFQITAVDAKDFLSVYSPQFAEKVNGLQKVLGLPEKTEKVVVIGKRKPKVTPTAAPTAKAPTAKAPTAKAPTAKAPTAKAPGATPSGATTSAKQAAPKATPTAEPTVKEYPSTIPELKRTPLGDIYKMVSELEARPYRDLSVKERVALKEMKRYQTTYRQHHGL